MSNDVTIKPIDPVKEDSKEPHMHVVLRDGRSFRARGFTHIGPGGGGSSDARKKE